MSDYDSIAALFERLQRRRREGRFANVKLPHITCPRCGRTSYNPNDVREGYCGNCHDWTAPRDDDPGSVFPSAPS